MVKIGDTLGADHDAPAPPRGCPWCGVTMTEGQWRGPIFCYDHAVVCPEYHRVEQRELHAGMASMFLRDSGIPGSACSLSEYQDRYWVTAGNASALSVARHFQAAIERLGRPPRSGFGLLGPPGTGKSTLAAATARSCCDLRVRTRWVNLPEEVGRLKSRFGRDDGESEVARLLLPAVLVLDDLGREKPAAWVVDQLLYPLLEGRIASGRPIIVTTNESLESLEARYGGCCYSDGTPQNCAAAMMSRLRQLIAAWVPVSGPDRRAAEADWL